MTTNAERYRRWLWTYPSEWRAANEDAAVGVLAEAAADGSEPGWRDWWSLAIAGMRTNVRQYGGGAWVRSRTAGRTLRDAARIAAVPAVVIAIALLIVDLAAGLRGVQYRTSWNSALTVIEWVPAQGGAPADLSPIGATVLIFAVGGLLAAFTGARRLAALCCCVGASVGVLAMLARFFADQLSGPSDAAPGYGTTLAASVLLAAGAFFTLDRRAAKATHLLFGVGVLAALALDRGLFGGSLDIGVLTIAPLPIGAPVTSLVLSFASAWFIAASKNRGLAVAAIGLLVFPVWFGLSSVVTSLDDTVVVRQLLETALLVVSVLAIFIALPRTRRTSSESVRS